jgi:hypothetical protein
MADDCAHVALAHRIAALLGDNGAIVIAELDNPHVAVMIVSKEREVSSGAHGSYPNELDCSPITTNESSDHVNQVRQLKLIDH